MGGNKGRSAVEGGMRVIEEVDEIRLKHTSWRLKLMTRQEKGDEKKRREEESD